MKNFNINITYKAKSDLKPILGVLLEALKDKRADTIFWDDIIPGITTIKKKELRHLHGLLIFTEGPGDKSYLID